MENLSKACELSNHYTNHCIRVTGATKLARCGKYIAKQIMSITGHKSIQSLCIYQRVKEDEMLMMGLSLTYLLLHPKEVTEVKAALRRQMGLQEIENEIDMQDKEPVQVNAAPALPLALHQPKDKTT